MLQTKIGMPDAALALKAHARAVASLLESVSLEDMFKMHQL